jgi:TetR/AcrR family transcriptional repressor of nem operon
MIFDILMDDDHNLIVKRKIEARSMRVSQEEKDRSHAKIVASAARLIRERGLDGASLGEVMQAAGMTHGGFYRHFSSKEALAQAAIEGAFAEILAGLDDGDPRQALERYRERYLSDEHIRNPGHGCPIAAVGPEIARAPARLKSAIGAGVRTVVARLAGVLKGSAEARETAAYRELSMMVGAIVIARASDPATARLVMKAARGANSPMNVERGAARRSGS